MQIAVLSEIDSVETRVAATPEKVKKYRSLCTDVAV
jgi:NAD(P) transhydrogenase subunit alpha